MSIFFNNGFDLKLITHVRVYISLIEAFSMEKKVSFFFFLGNFLDTEVTQYFHKTHMKETSFVERYLWNLYS